MGWQIWIRMFGRQGTRVFYGALGGVAVIGAVLLTGMLD